MSRKKDHKTLPINASKGQKRLATVLNDMFNGMTIWYEVSLSDLGPSPTDALYYGVDGMSVDFYIKELDIAIEYQGKQHYAENSFYSGQPARDKKKREFLEDCGIKLVEIPYTLGENFTQEDIRKELEL
jgi:hypothetical protein